MNYFRHDCQMGTDISNTRQRSPSEHNPVVLRLCQWYGSIGSLAAGKSTAIRGDILETFGYVSRDISLCYIQYIVSVLIVEQPICIFFSILFILTVFLSFPVPFLSSLSYFHSASYSVCKSGIWRNSDKEIYFVFLLWLRGWDCVRACVVAPTSSRFGKGTICVLRTQGGVRWTPQKVIK
jgi:hypothetical protein